MTTLSSTFTNIDFSFPQYTHGASPTIPPTRFTVGDMSKQNYYLEIYFPSIWGLCSDKYNLFGLHQNNHSISKIVELLLLKFCFSKIEETELKG